LSTSPTLPANPFTVTCRSSSARTTRAAARSGVAARRSAYAASLGAFTWTPQVTMFTTWPKRWARIAGSRPMVSRTGST
jgi:hypothetical protein